jgi:uncharacterized phage protein (TIGR02218 family)
MRATPAPLLAHMALGTTTLALLIKLTRTDGTVLAVTTHDQDITYPPGGGLLYSAVLGMDASAMQAEAQLNVDNLETKGFLAYLGVSEAEIAAGLWDYCDVRIYRVNYADLSMGDEKLIRGWIGTVSHGRGEFTSEVRSLAQKLQSRVGELVTDTCKADLYDARCKVEPTEGVYRFSGIAVTAVLAEQRQFTCAALAQPEDFFTAGRVVWTSGGNAGLSKEIKKHAADGTLTLQEPMPYVIAPGNDAALRGPA